MREFCGRTDGPAGSLFITPVFVDAVALHQGHADGATGRVALVLAVQVALPAKQFALFVQVLLPVSPIPLHAPPLPAPSVSSDPLLPGPVALPRLDVLGVLSAEHRQAVHAVVGDEVAEELREAGRHDPHAAAFVI